uniref:Histone-lysine N-methyltransferase, H3 lysine-79 specific n=1 Tax=Aureoumbra lagunensis TaxID=44058 RepID=A0A7S3K3M8_9STRA|mmetsp:Transcript_20366/g.26403  ORF Transcript_20366/g.26403 Transcript_20366/m.26403 type:complete len:265 (-) Transcript_20366:266-1060(-)
MARLRKRSTSPGCNDEEVYEKVIGELLSSKIGYNVSRRERENSKQMQNDIFHYGETGYVATRRIVEAGLEHGCKGEVFIDLGSGMGKVVLGAAIAHHFQMCIGVEKLEGLYELSLELQKQFEATDLIDSRLKSKILFSRSDLFQFDVSNADLIYCHTALFNEKEIFRLAKWLAGDIKLDAIVITVSYELPTSFGFETVEYLPLKLDGDVDAILFVSRLRKEQQNNIISQADVDEDLDDLQLRECGCSREYGGTPVKEEINIVGS